MGVGAQIGGGEQQVDGSHGQPARVQQCVWDWANSIRRLLVVHAAGGRVLAVGDTDTGGEWPARFCSASAVSDTLYASLRSPKLRGMDGVEW